MKLLLYPLLRAVVALVIGFLLIQYPDHTLTGLTVAIGILFLVAGVISIIGWLVERHRKPVFTAYDSGVTQQESAAISHTAMFPVVGMGSLVFGLFLCLMPATFVALLMYLIAALLILGALNLYMNLFAMRTMGRVPFAYWILPTVVLLAGIFVVVKPMEAAEVPFIILGWALLVHGVTELICSIKFYAVQRAFNKSQTITVEATPDSSEGEETALDSPAEELS